MNEVKARFPKKLKSLETPSRYKFLKGGRGSGKSWGVARKLLIRGAQKQIRVLCTREVQKSIKNSVHQLLKDQIASLGLSQFYQVLDTEIRGANGTRFLFSGLSDLTADTIKSFEGVDICWIEEGQSISDRSLKILTPTIRAEGSEIWVTYNPELETDPIHVMATDPDLDSTVIEMNHDDNPWFPAVLEQERLHAKQSLSKAEYEHIWEGKCLPAVAGAIYFDQVADAESSGRVCPIKHDVKLKTHTVWDLGFNDSTFIVFVQRVASEVRIIDAIEDNKRTIVSYIQDDLKPRDYNWGVDWLPHDAFATRHQSGVSDAEVFRSLGRTVQPVTNESVETGIRRSKELFEHVWFNSESVGVMRLLECLKRYRRHISKATDEAGRPVHDEYSHGADCFRYLSLSAAMMRNETSRLPTTKRKPRSSGGWMS